MGRIASTMVTICAMSGLLACALPGCQASTLSGGAPATGGAEVSYSIASKFPYYLQTDPAWGEATLGGSGETLAAMGCMVTCVASALTGLGFETTPGELCEGLKTHGGFTENGYIVWNGVSELTNHDVEIMTEEPGPEAIDEELGQGRPALVKVMLGGTMQHWVLIVAKNGGEYFAIDPMNQARRLVPVSSLSDRIYALRVFRTRTAGSGLAPSQSNAPSRPRRVTVAVP